QRAIGGPAVAGADQRRARTAEGGDRFDQEGFHQDAGKTGTEESIAAQQESGERHDAGRSHRGVGGSRRRDRAAAAQRFWDTASPARRPRAASRRAREAALPQPLRAPTAVVRDYARRLSTRRAKV